MAFTIFDILYLNEKLVDFMLEQNFSIVSVVVSVFAFVISVLIIGSLTYHQ